jgi:hypothetical protein
MEKETFIFYADAGHAWLKVPKNAVETLGIADRITCYSYRKSDAVYLEEDCDAPLFVEAFREKYGVPPKVVKSPAVNSSRIRTYQSYK